MFGYLANLFKSGFRAPATTTVKEGIQTVTEEKKEEQNKEQVASTSAEPKIERPRSDSTYQILQTSYE